MQFTQVPNQYAPVGGALSYAVETGAGEKTLEVTLTDVVKGTVFGRKRFVGVSGVRFDIAPYVRRVVWFEPRIGRTGVYGPDGRVPAVVVEAAEGVQAAAQRAGGADAGPLELAAGGVAPMRYFVPGLFEVAAPALLTEMPRQRLIGPAESDELTLLTDRAGQVVVTAEVSGEQVVAQYALPGAGVHLFRLDMRDFQGAETVRVDAGACGVVEYAVVPVPEGARRVAWRSRAGALEHYTFPQEQKTVVEGVKKRAYGAGGYVAEAREEWQMELVSAYEGRKMLETLSGLLCSPQVWLVSQSGYRPVDVLTDRSTVYSNGVMSRMELLLRPARKTTLPWS